MKNLKILRTALLVATAVGLMAVPAFAVDYYLIAKPVDKTMPDGNVITMWGYAEDDGGACYNTTVGGENSTASRVARRNAPVCNDPVATVPGPRITVGGAGILRIYLVNLLDESTSIVIAGQEMPFSGANNGPTWTDNSTGARTNASQRVRSFGRETRFLGGRRQYIWSPGRNNQFPTGSYIYRSGTHPQLQVQMGLYGSSSRNAAVNNPYAGVPVDNEADMLFSEIDPALHAAVAAGNYTACTDGVEACAAAKAAGNVTSTLEYKPKYFLINGEAFNPASPSTLLSAATGNRVLLRMMNATYRELVPMLLNGHADLIAEGGRPYTVNTVVAGNITGQTNHAKTQYAFDLAAGATKDVVLTLQQAGTYWVLDRRLNLTTAGASGGGFRAGIQATP